MVEANRHISVSKREIEPVVARLSLIYERVSGSDGPGDYRDANHEFTPAWCIGQTLAACGGYELMWLAFRAVEERSGPDCAEWLDRSWDGITIPGVVLWSAARQDQPLSPAG